MLAINAVPIEEGSARPPAPKMAQATSRGQGGGEPMGDWAWVPIRSLSARQRVRVANHLNALGESDRYLRFGYPATDAQISKYVDSLDFERDEVFGIFNRHLELIAMAHLAHPAAHYKPLGIISAKPG